MKVHSDKNSASACVKEQPADAPASSALAPARRALTKATASQSIGGISDGSAYLW
eukprot:CAMPEP_0177202860 /NCGR_PEP_ID=MMETSP0367-20130122/27510_1 /TAXON_ID=447022 ORGANISM="Scrippsiella hangoei-like, Strain SHHI-4" /NCGR_SAMPLE_ID=MMETSP0367 /ASSEMBLY_ACC=CAM_ASM_000362 /LENGTH=54 /DNA_ID=CAMNT_0018651459 /DNA_START=100 /DNA_END=261 /DNA_ORIENTATION=-